MRQFFVEAVLNPQVVEWKTGDRQLTVLIEHCYVRVSSWATGQCGGLLEWHVCCKASMGHVWRDRMRSILRRHAEIQSKSMVNYGIQ